MNRRSLSEIPLWIDDRVYCRSIFQYGLPPSVRHLIDRPVGDDPTYSDILVYLAKQLHKPVRYLEIGVSVGKNFYQILRSSVGVKLVAFDIEDVNPTLEAKLSFEHAEFWETRGDSMRSSRSSLRRYRSENGTEVVYLAGDVFDRGSWDRLRGQQFNLVFSDAYHSGEALLQEYGEMQRLNLIDPDEFVLVWDDLDNSPMRRAFRSIARDLTERYRLPPTAVSTEYLRGWLGINEPHHAVGVVRNLGRRTGTQ